MSKTALPPLDGLAKISDESCALLRERFRTVGFVPELVAEAESFFPGALRSPRLPIVRWWLERRPELGAALARLFVYDDTLTEMVARNALGPELLACLLDAGVLEHAPNGGITTRFLVSTAQAGLYVLSDPLGAGRDAVMGPGGGTEQLCHLVPNGFFGSVLDLGTGAGTLALVAARRGARRAIGVDLNLRAVEMARFNARLNGLDVEFRVGDGAEPVAGERFDRVLCQPPFVGRPPELGERTFLFGGAAGDELPLVLLGAVPKVLATGGRAIFLIQSAERRGEPLMQRVRRALAAASMHVLILAGTGPTPARQASVFAAFEDPLFGPDYTLAVRRYLDHFEALGIHSFDGAIVVVTNPESVFGEGRYALGLSLPNPPDDAATLERFLTSLDFIEGPDELLERTRLRLSPHARVTPRPNPEDPASDGGVVIRILAPGIGTDWAISSAELEVLAAIHGSTHLGSGLDAVIQAAPPLAAMRGDLRAFARTALLHGALVRVE